MDKVRLETLKNDDGIIYKLDIGGLLLLQYTDILKKELLELSSKIGSSLNITISEPLEIDLTGIQVLISFFNSLEKSGISFQVQWQIDVHKQLLLNNVGFSKYLKINSY